MDSKQILLTLATSFKQYVFNEKLRTYSKAIKVI